MVYLTTMIHEIDCGCLGLGFEISYEESVNDQPLLIYKFKNISNFKIANAV